MLTTENILRSDLYPAELKHFQRIAKINESLKVSFKLFKWNLVYFFCSLHYITLDRYGAFCSWLLVTSFFSLPPISQLGCLKYCKKNHFSTTALRFKTDKPSRSTEGASVPQLEVARGRRSVCHYGRDNGSANEVFGERPISSNEHSCNKLKPASAYSAI